MTSPLEYLIDLEVTEITLDAVTEAPLHIPAQTWVIVEKLREDPCRLTREDVSDGIGVSYTSAKFLCHPAGPGSETKLAFMRIYQQVPIAGIEFKPSLRASQAVRVARSLLLSICTCPPRPEPRCSYARYRKKQSRLEGG